MEAWGWIIIVLVVVAAAAAAWWVGMRRRSGRLRERFGPEYERTVSRAETPAQGEAELEARELRRTKLDIRPLDPDEREQYLLSWKEVQAIFVDDPKGAVASADRQVTDVMLARGYPMDDFERRAADISVDHPGVVENYRAAHSVFEASDESGAETEDLRRAFVHYRALFEELLETRDEEADVRNERAQEDRD
jgi:hypothetical protein